jgi:hypothetical protein
MPSLDKLKGSFAERRAKFMEIDQFSGVEISLMAAGIAVPTLLDEIVSKAVTMPLLTSMAGGGSGTELTMDQVITVNNIASGISVILVFLIGFSALYFGDKKKDKRLQYFAIPMLVAQVLLLLGQSVKGA